MSINVRSALDLLTGSGCNLRKDGVSCFRRFIERREKKTDRESEERSVKLRRDQRCLHMIDKKINNHRNKIICPYLKITSSLYLSYYVRTRDWKSRELRENVPGGRDNTSLLAFSSSSTTRVYKYREVRTLNLVFLFFSFLILINLASFRRAIVKKLRRVFTCLGCYVFNWC